MNVVIVEDESLAAEKLERYLIKHDKNITVIKILSSITESVNWFLDNTDFDIVFMDIQLTDGLSFDIFNRVTITKPIIFTTAFDEFAVDAFQVNSIDYLLKPITFTALSRALTKFKNMQLMFKPGALSNVSEIITNRKTKDRFLVKLGNHIHSVKTEEIALFYAEGRTVYLLTKEQKKFIIDFKLEEVCELLEERLFFRVNRSVIININDIKDVLVYSNSRLKIIPTIKLEKEIIVSREKVSKFKNWLSGS